MLIRQEQIWFIPYKREKGNSESMRQSLRVVIEALSVLMLGAFPYRSFPEMMATAPVERRLFSLTERLRSAINPAGSCKRLRFKHKYLLIATLVFLLLCWRSTPVYTSSPAYTALSPYPTAYVAEGKGEVFDVAVKISQVENLYSCEFTITYNSSLLAVTEVSVGSFFPEGVDFEFENNQSSGFVTATMAHNDPYTPLSGNGILMEVTFEVIRNIMGYVGSTLKLSDIKLLDPDLEPISNTFVSAVFFWKWMQPNAPEGERVIDLYTQKDGEGLGESGGFFEQGETVEMIARVSYEGWPEQGLLVAFQVINSQGQTALVFINRTNEDGLARISFGIPDILESLGRWTAIATVDIACEAVWDTLSFWVVPPSIGGSTLSIPEPNTEASASQYLMLTGTLAVCFVMARRIAPNPKKRR